MFYCVGRRFLYFCVSHISTIMMSQKINQSMMCFNEHRHSHCRRRHRYCRRRCRSCRRHHLRRPSHLCPDRRGLGCRCRCHHDRRRIRLGNMDFDYLFDQKCHVVSVGLYDLLSWSRLSPSLSQSSPSSSHYSSSPSLSPYLRAWSHSLCLL